jgi:hypothetical protein
VRRLSGSKTSFPFPSPARRLGLNQTSERGIPRRQDALSSRAAESLARRFLKWRSYKRVCATALGSALVASCVGNDPDASGPAPIPAPGPADSGTTPDVGPGATADALPQGSYCATHPGLFCADFDQEGPIDREWSRTRKLGSASFAYSDLFYASPPRGATAHLDALPDSGTPSNSIVAQFERDLPIDGARHLHLEAAVRIDVPSVLPPRAQIQYLAMYFGPNPIGSVSLFADASAGWIVYVSRYQYVDQADSGVTANDNTIPLKEKFPTARMVPVKLDLYLGTPTRVRFEVGGVVTEQESIAATEIAARGPTTWTAKVGPLQARGDTPATDLTVDNVLATKD